MAAVIADCFRCHDAGTAATILENIGDEVSPKFLRLVADELEGKRQKSDIRHNGRIIEAWIGASYRCGAKHGPLLNLKRSDTPQPTMLEVKVEYARLFVSEKQPESMTSHQWVNDLATRKKKKIPSDPSFRKTLRAGKCECRGKTQTDRDY